MQTVAAEIPVEAAILVTVPLSENVVVVVGVGDGDVAVPVPLHAGARISSGTTPRRLTIDQKPGDEGSVIDSRPR